MLRRCRGSREVRQRFDESGVVREADAEAGGGAARLPTQERTEGGERLG